MPYNVPQYQPPRLKRSRPRGHNAHYLTKQWKAIRSAVLVRDLYTCQQCRRVVHGRAAQVDHIIARADGGTDDMHNLQVLCDKCHGAKFWHEHARRK